MNDDTLDVLVVGAGLSGIGAGFHLQRSCPQRTFEIVEARERMGGTWDLFRYPGVRSDSDMHTLGFSFRPWPNPQAIADGPSILAYIQDTAREVGLDAKIRYGLRVEAASWSSRDACWTVQMRDVKTGARSERRARFVFMCSGYYDYEQGYTPDLPGRSRFLGRVVHPQFWPEDLDYSNKRVVVIGSGATAVTLVPEMAKRASHVVMLQRSPTYVMSVPEKDVVANWMREHLPSAVATGATRWKNVLLMMAFYNYCKKFPARAKRLIVREVKKAVGDKVDVAAHFTPRYNPWEQRLCFVPDGDLFHALNEGRASVVTDEIETFTERGLKLRSGEELVADVVVTATGLVLKFLGGVTVSVDGTPVRPTEGMTYKGMMLSDVPNMALAVGYTNASWTLKCDLTCEYVCRLLNHMSEHGFSECRPVLDDPSVKPLPLIDFNSGYVQRGIDKFPKQGSKKPWRLYQNYALDTVTIRHGKLDDGVMRFK